MNKADRRQKLQIFFSADIVGSSAFKGKNPAESGNSNWAHVFYKFFDEFTNSFIEGYSKFIDKKKEIIKIRIWKINGDEILYRLRLSSEEEVSNLCIAFYETLIAMDEKYWQTKKLGVKGCIWTAGFPIRNKEFKISISGEVRNKIIKIKNEPPDQITGYGYPSNDKRFIDFIGMEMDAGFRLTKHTRQRKLVVSVDIADFLTRQNDTNSFRFSFHLVGWEELKGCYKSIVYPIIWLSKKGKENSRVNMWEGQNDPFTKKFYTNDCFECSKIQEIIVKFREDYNFLIKNKNFCMIRPYIKGLDMDEGHEREWNEHNIDESITLNKKQ